MNTENYNCTDENRCEECIHCLRTRPCECGCGLLGGTCMPESDEEEGWDGDLDYTPNCFECGENCGHSIISHQKYKNTYFCSEKCNKKYDGEESDEEEEDYESSNCETCGKNYLLDKLEVKDDKFYCRSCFEDDNQECCENCHEKTSCAEWIDYIGNNILYCDECYERHKENIEKKCEICEYRQSCPNKDKCTICIDV